jgi:SHS2 domain-containing protein
VRSERTVEFSIAGDDVDYLLFDWLSELLYRFEREHFLASEIDVTRTANGLTARVRGETLDPARHIVSHEVKAITYHQLHVQQTADGWEVEVIVDI